MGHTKNEYLNKFVDAAEESVANGHGKVTVVLTDSYIAAQEASAFRSKANQRGIAVASIGEGSYAFKLDEMPQRFVDALWEAIEITEEIAKFSKYKARETLALQNSENTGKLCEFIGALGLYRKDVVNGDVMKHYVLQKIQSGLENGVPVVYTQLRGQ
ncbi:MAG: hypothetical protein GOV01_04010 [Candidatus Altiarchaeota archaeon]|nr:hypothetical protein [Candidatus Altiarchaeota archaeon]